MDEPFGRDPKRRTVSADSFESLSDAKRTFSAVAPFTTPAERISNLSGPGTAHALAYFFSLSRLPGRFQYTVPGRFQYTVREPWRSLN